MVGASFIMNSVWLVALASSPAVEIGPETSPAGISRPAGVTGRFDSTGHGVASCFAFHRA
jgi:hypothetical protein